MKHASHSKGSSGSANDGKAKRDDEVKHGKHAASSRSGDADAARAPSNVGSSSESAKTRAMPAAGDSGSFDGFGAFAPLETMAEDGPVRDPKRRRKILAIVAGVVVGLLAATYFAGVAFFSGHFFPNTTIGGVDISLESTDDVEKHIDATSEEYVLDVGGWGFSLALSSRDIGLDVDSAAIAELMIGSLNPWAWPVEVFQSRDVGDNMIGVYDDTGLNDIVRAAVEQHNATATPSSNATIGYSEQEGRVVVVPEVNGTQLDVDAVIKAVDEAVTRLDTDLRLTEAQLVHPEITSDDPRLAAAAEQATFMVRADMPLMMAGNEVARMDGEVLTGWITLDENFNATLDESQIAAWVDDLVARLNTVGSERTYTRPDGKVITVSGGVYGWEVDRDALLESVKAGVSSGSTDAIEVPCTQSASVYNGQGVQDWGARYIDIDLSEQHVYFYDESGTLVWDSPCISGQPSSDGRYNTSTGVFTINTMASPSKLIGYENGEKIYESTVQYWMPFDGNVIGLHDADWQPWGSYYSDMYADGYGSHGCVNLPPSNAASLYSMIRSGDVVVCHW